MKIFFKEFIQKSYLKTEYNINCMYGFLYNCTFRHFAETLTLGPCPPLLNLAMLEKFLARRSRTQHILVDKSLYA